MPRIKTSLLAASELPLPVQMQPGKRAEEENDSLGTTMMASSQNYVLQNE